MPPNLSLLVHPQADSHGKDVTDEPQKHLEGAILLWEQDAPMHPIEYWSRTPTEYPKKLRATDKECIASKQAIFLLSTYVKGFLFIITTDHNALKLVLTMIKQLVDMPLVIRSPIAQLWYRPMRGCETSNHRQVLTTKQWCKRCKNARNEVPVMEIFDHDHNRSKTPEDDSGEDNFDKRWEIEHKTKPFLPVFLQKRAADTESSPIVWQTLDGQQMNPDINKSRTKSTYQEATSPWPQLFSWNTWRPLMGQSRYTCQTCTGSSIFSNMAVLDIGRSGAGNKHVKHSAHPMVLATYDKRCQ